MLATSEYHNSHDIDTPSAGPHVGVHRSQSLSSFDISPQRIQPDNPPRIEADTGTWFGVLEVAEHGNFARFKRDAIWVDAAGNAWEREALRPDGLRERQQRVDALAAAGTEGNREFSVGLDAAGNVAVVTTEMVAKRGKCGGARRNQAERKSSFGKASRKNLLDAFNQIDTRHDMLMCTLTFPDELPSNEWKQWKRMLDNWLKRLGRKYPLVSGAWRLEMKRRLSGSMMGEFAPHFHLILFDLWGSNAERGVSKYMILTEFRLWASASWAEVLGVDAVRVNSDWVSGRKATGYVSRYVGKIPVEDAEQLPDVGRHWGWFNRSELPFSGVVKFVIDTFSQGRLLGLMRAIAGIPVDKRWKLPSIRVYKSLYELLELLFERNVGIVSGNVNAIGEYVPAGA